MSKRQINDENNDYNLQRSICAFGVASVLAFNTASASALPEISIVNEANNIYTSSIQLSQTIKTMDFSMPSSYDSISDVSKPASEELVQEENIATGSKKKVKSSASTKSSSAMTPEEKAALAAEKQAEKEAIAAERAAEKARLDAEKAESKRIERLAKEEAKEKAKAEKESKAKEEMMKGVEFVDMGLPSYGSSTAREEKSAYAL